MKITPEHLQAVTKKIIAENKKLTKKVKETKDEEETLTALDALKELEDLAVTGDLSTGDGDDGEDTGDKDTSLSDLEGDSDENEDLDEVLNLGPRKSDDECNDEHCEEDECEDEHCEEEDDEDDADDDEVTEKHGDKNTKGWRKNTRGVRECDDDEVEVTEDDDLDDSQTIDESLLSDALGSIGQGIKGLIKLCGKGVLVLIAGLGGSFLFGLPGLLVAVMIAFGLMGGSNESTRRQVEEGLGAGVKQKLKSVIGALKKMDKETLKALNDKAKSGKEGAKQVADMLKSGNFEKAGAEAVDEEGDCCECEVIDDDEVTEKHGDKNTKGWRKNSKLRECEIEVSDDDEDEIDVTEDDDLASKLDQLDADELKKLNPEQKEKLQALLGEEDDDEVNESVSVTTPRQMLRFLKESKTMNTNAVVRHAARRFAKMIKESSPKASLVARKLNRCFKDKAITERRFCQAFTRAVLG